MKTLRVIALDWAQEPSQRAALALDSEVAGTAVRAERRASCGWPPLLLEQGLASPACAVVLLPLGVPPVGADGRAVPVHVTAHADVDPATL